MAESLRIRSLNNNKRILSPISTVEQPNKIFKKTSSKRSWESERMANKHVVDDDDDDEELPYGSHESSFDDDGLFDDDLDDDIFNSVLTQPNGESINEASGKEEISEATNGHGSGLTNASSSPANTFFGLPFKTQVLLQKFRKIDKLHDWQERLMKELLEKDCNMIYCVPTGGGKTIVAELMLLREVVLHNRDAILVLPFISIVQEKMRALLPFAESLGFALEEYAGGKGSYPVKKRKSMRSLFVCTIEMAHVVVTSLLEDNRIDDIGLVVIDELHMIGESGSRGVNLETLLVKFKLATKSNQQQSNKVRKLRMLGMSATLSNLEELGKFLDAEIYRDDNRPVELKQFVKRGFSLTEVTRLGKGLDWESLPTTAMDEDHKQQDPENLRVLVGDIIPGKSVLVFCATKKHCENVAQMLSSFLNHELLEYKRPQKQKLILKMHDVNNGQISPVLRKTLPFGIAYHHSGLTPDERRIVEDGFRKQIISCICCTSTLAAGVNLPAERVIIRSPYIGINFLTKAEYQQICGRAGRPGLCTYGESILIYESRDADRVRELLEQPVAHCKSGLVVVENMSAFILSSLQLKLVSEVNEIKQIVKEMTLCGLQNDHSKLDYQVDTCLANLVELKLLEFNESEVFVTSVGKGVVKSLIDVNRSREICQGLLEAQNNMFLSTYLHLIYMVTLLFEDTELVTESETDASVLMDAFQQLDEREVSAAESFGIKHGTINKYMIGGKPSLEIRRFFVSLIVYEVWKKRTDLFMIANK